jgi:DNA polymerase
MTTESSGVRHASTAAAFLPARLSLQGLRRAAAGCSACPLHLRATQTVFGEGLARSDVMAIGEQPGDQEDRQGHPFVGPAGRVLHDGFERAGIAPDRVYITNAVKHFKWTERGKRRIHQRPNRDEIEACHPWLEAELAVVDPRAVLLLGATAAQALLGPSFRVTRERGRLLSSDLAPIVIATVHPASVLRADDREGAMAGFVDDLTTLATALATDPNKEPLP